MPCSSRYDSRKNDEDGYECAYNLLLVYIVLILSLALIGVIR